MSDEHPYKAFETNENWKIVEKAIADLVDNQDLKEMTDRKYIVGYICKLLSES
ncbi:MAG: hypothetical protein OQK95_03175 [Gammaproteobacteria bacterium]|nr:hypothetical protein [Gammaproteobacteria bacterium]